MKNIHILFIALLTLLTSALSAQCTLACNSETVISLDPFNEGIELTPLHILEGDFTSCDPLTVSLLDPVSNDVIYDFAESIPLDCADRGDYTVVVREDASGNTCWGSLQVQSSLPIVVVLNLSTALFDADGVELYAIDFDNGSFNNCNGDLRFTFGSTPPESDPNYDDSINSSSRVFTCDDYLSGDDGAVDLTITVWDEYGNFNTALTQVVLVPEGGDDGFCNLTFEEDEIPVEISKGHANGTTLTLNGTEDIAQKLGKFYAINEDQIQNGTNVITFDVGDLPFLQNISTLDLVFFQRGFLFGFDSFFQQVSADVDSDGVLSTSDLLLMRRLILGMEEGDNLTDAKIYAASDTMGFDPFALSYDNNFQQVNFESDAIPQEGFDLIILKNGDLNGFNSDDELEGRSSQTIEFEDVYVEAGQPVTLEFTVSNPNGISGLTSKIDFEELNIQNIDFNQYSDQTLSFINDENIAISFLPYVPQAEFKFSIDFESKTNGWASEFVQLDQDFYQEIIDSKLSTIDLILESNRVSSSILPYPNPSSNKMLVNIPTHVDVYTYTVRDITGKVIISKSSTQKVLEIEKSQMTGTGIYILSIETLSEGWNHKIIFE